MQHLLFKLTSEPSLFQVEREFSTIGIKTENQKAFSRILFRFVIEFNEALSYANQNQCSYTGS